MEPFGFGKPDPAENYPRNMHSSEQERANRARVYLVVRYCITRDLSGAIPGPAGAGYPPLLSPCYSAIHPPCHGNGQQKGAGDLLRHGMMSGQDPVTGTKKWTGKTGNGLFSCCTLKKRMDDGLISAHAAHATRGHTARRSCSF